MIEYNCPMCGSGMISPENMAGSSEKCPSCGNVAMVPSPHAVHSPPTPVPASSAGSPNIDVEILGVLRRIHQEVRWVSFWSKLAIVILMLLIFFGIAGIIIVF